MSSSNGDRRSLRVGVVGAGFSGVGIGVRLRQEGFEDFTIFERGDSVGGVWRANTYPGAACDVPSHLYSLSFAPNHQWSERYSGQEEILAYLEGVAGRFGLMPHIRFGIEAVEASFDEAAGTWTLETDDGESHEFDLLLTACGQLTRPSVPPIPGADEFKGPAFHSAEWDHDVDLEGKRVAVIGTGASAIQFVPEIAKSAAQTTVYQRSAPWILPRGNRPYPEWERRLFERLPLRPAASRLGIFAAHEALTRGFTGSRWVMGPVERLANHFREQSLRDPELRAQATPDYPIGCNRVLLTDDWYPAIARDDVELIGGGAERITAGGIVGADGVEREADVIIYGTGFQSHNFVAPMDIHGLDGRDLNEVWANRPEAYLGSTISGFPNFFVLYGPNTAHGAGSALYTLECQFRYVIDAIERLRDGGFRYIELRPEAQAEWRREIEERSRETTWVSGGCSNWYVNEDGINTNNWPGSWLEFRRRTHRINPGDYRVAV